MMPVWTIYAGKKKLDGALSFLFGWLKRRYSLYVYSFYVETIEHTFGNERIENCVIRYIGCLF